MHYEEGGKGRSRLRWLGSINMDTKKEEVQDDD